MLIIRPEVVLLGKALPASRLTPLASSRAVKNRSKRGSSCEASSQDISQSAQTGDVATIHFTAFGEQGERLQSTRDAGQALNFEVGSSSAVGNELLSVFDTGIIGMRIGETRQLCLESKQDNWNEELLFRVPTDHAEIQRLEGKFRSSGGLSEGMIIELANGQQAQVVKKLPGIIILDANDATAGRELNFDVELVGLQKSDG